MNRGRRIKSCQLFSSLTRRHTIQRNYRVHRVSIDHLSRGSNFQMDLPHRHLETFSLQTRQYREFHPSPRGSRAAAAEISFPIFIVEYRASREEGAQRGECVAMGEKSLGRFEWYTGYLAPRISERNSESASRVKAVAM